MSLDQFFDRRYNRNTYNCAHLVADVWEAETGECIRQALAGFLAPPADRRAAWSLARDFVPLTRPAAPCIVLMRRPRSPSHVGIYIRERVAHIREPGFAYQPLNVATLGFSIVRFYGYANRHHRP